MANAVCLIYYYFYLTLCKIFQKNVWMNARMIQLALEVNANALKIVPLNMYLSVGQMEGL